MREAPALELLAQHQVDQDATAHGDQAHDHRRIPAVPDGQAVFGQRAADHRQGRRGQQRANRLGREHADHQAGQHQQFDRRTHPARGLMGCVGQVGGRGAEEHIDGKAQGIGHAEGTGDGRDYRQGCFDPGGRGNEHRFGEKHLLGQETVEQGHAGHGGAGDHGQGRGKRYQPEQSTEAANVAGAALVVDDARGHEQRGLESGVVEDVKHCGYCRQRAVEAQQQGDQAQVADGRVGQQALEVILEHGRVGAQQQGACPGAADDPEPFFAARQ
ncbi:hypothetical protein D9M71_494270 [compost metagenome]